MIGPIFLIKIAVFMTATINFFNSALIRFIASKFAHLAGCTVFKNMNSEIADGRLDDALSGHL